MSIIIPTLGPKVYKYGLHWAIWILRDRVCWPGYLSNSQPPVKLEAVIAVPVAELLLKGPCR